MLFHKPDYGTEDTNQFDMEQFGKQIVSSAMLSNYSVWKTNCQLCNAV